MKLYLLEAILVDWGFVYLHQRLVLVRNNVDQQLIFHDFFLQLGVNIPKGIL